MPDDKEIWWAEGPDDAERDIEGTSGDESSTRGAESWDAYRKWLSRRGDRRRGRDVLEPSLYTWKGYRNWAEEVKRNWSDRHRNDRDES